MEHDSEITPKMILDGGSRLHSRYPAMVSGKELNTPSAPEIAASAAAHYRSGYDAGVWRRLSNIVLEPRNPFAIQEHRRLRPEGVIVGVLLFGIICLIAFFNAAALEVK